MAGSQETRTKPTTAQQAKCNRPNMGVIIDGRGEGSRGFAWNQNEVIAGRLEPPVTAVSRAACDGAGNPELGGGAAIEIEGL